MQHSADSDATADDAASGIPLAPAGHDAAAAGHNAAHEPRKQRRAALRICGVSVVAAAACVLALLLAASLAAVAVLAAQLQRALPPPPPPPPFSATPRGQRAPATPGAVLWPRPRAASFGPAGTAGTVRVSPQLEVAVAAGGAQSLRISRAAALFRQRLFFATGCPEPAGLAPAANASAPVLARVVVTLDAGDDVPLAAASEAYSLVVPANGSDATIRAASPAGAVRALESLAQLITPITPVPAFVLRAGACGSANFTAALAANASFLPGFVINNAPLTIDDAPRFAHRGLLLDSARHFLPVQTILHIIDGMAAAKLNVLHWHAVDSQSFPIRSTAFPALAQRGAYSPWQTYSPADVAAIVEYADTLAIRVVPEFDVPGHSYAWGLGIANLTVCANKQPWGSYCAEPPCGQLDISNEQTYSFLATLLKEQAAAFPDALFHLGSDEVNRACFTDDPGVAAFLSRSGWSVDRLIANFTLRAQDMVRASNKTPVFWEEAVLETTADLPKDTIIQAWRGVSSVAAVASRGFRVIATPASMWYLDCGRGSFTDGGNSWCDPFKTWASMYMYNPLQGLTPEQQKLVIGGEAAMWNELVDDANLVGIVFPRAAAVSEALWLQDSAVRDWGEASQRMDRLRSILVARGVDASPIWPEFCRDGSCI
ncbi:Glucosamine-6-phosphate isomerase (Glucosamine-6-phosphate deaminase) (GNPDA) (GlcN6P deaminase) [Polyrhizophydium stewartii]|uniref:Beta-hexosaminidase n=1 Tax=Polyrhizophydium stewartii TaxID=2732419 RepID=A0ABR4N7W9_9FUNG